LEVVPLLAELRAMPGRPHLVLTDNVGYYGKYEAAIRKSPTSWGFWMGCRAGLQTIGIESNGNVKGCLSLPSERHGRRSFVEGNLRTHSLSEIWHREGGFADTREFGEQDLGGFCRECNYRDVCRGGCLWMSYACSGDPRDNRFCFYRQAVEAEAWELLDEADIPAAQALRERTRTR
jgi:radical SAM protein with 4Fe4S-binding SPASM domain